MDAQRSVWSSIYVTRSSVSKRKELRCEATNGGPTAGFPKMQKKRHPHSCRNYVDVQRCKTQNQHHCWMGAGPTSQPAVTVTPWLRSMAIHQLCKHRAPTALWLWISCFKASRCCFNGLAQHKYELRAIITACGLWTRWSANLSWSKVHRPVSLSPIKNDPVDNITCHGSNRPAQLSPSQLSQWGCAAVVLY